jgi:indole-3-glycerol phosphate synthase
LPSPTTSLRGENLLDCIVARIRKDEGPAFRAFSAATFSLARRPRPRSLLASFDRGFGLIAEAKKGSPSRGIIRKAYDPVALARAYEAAGAAAVSVVTEKNFFLGGKTHLRRVKRAVRLPVLRKDFLIHPRQILESYNLGADCVLLIAACLSPRRLEHLHRLAASLGLEALVEVHTPSELEMALQIKPRLIGINNRNLSDFSVDWETSLTLRKLIPRGIHVISESGLRTAEQVRFLREYGFSGVLVGEHLLRQADPGRALRELIRD